MSSKKVCEASLRWILHHRDLVAYKGNNRAYKKSLEQIVEDDGHTGGSMCWTQAQSNKIDQIGWHKWFNETEGPAGYGAHFEKFLKKFMSTK